MNLLKSFIIWWADNPSSSSAAGREIHIGYLEIARTGCRHGNTLHLDYLKWTHVKCDKSITSAAHHQDRIWEARQTGRKWRARRTLHVCRGRKQARMQFKKKLWMPSITSILHCPTHCSIITWVQYVNFCKVFYMCWSLGIG